MHVRDATADDVTAIQGVAERSWERDYPDIRSRETVAEGVHEWYSEDRIVQELDNADARIFVSEGSGDDVAGFVHTVEAETEGDVLRLYVDPDHRGEGVGSALLDRAVDHLFGQGVDRVKAMVLAQNDPGNAFYRSHGFTRLDDTQETEIAGQRYAEHSYVLER